MLIEGARTWELVAGAGPLDWQARASTAASAANNPTDLAARDRPPSARAPYFISRKAPPP
jgi:hypothetical protein